MLNSNRYLFVLFSVVFFAASCSNYQKLLKSDDYQLKYEKAIEYFEEERYDRTIRLLSDVIPVYRGTKKAETIDYYYSMAHYKQGDYILASHYFKSFVSVYPRSEHAEEFSFLSAYCKYLDSPRYNLDQTVTREAIRELQRFINRYPHSDKVEKSNELIDELRLKLEKKMFEIARLYHNISSFRASVRTMNNLIYDYPGTEFEEEALFYNIKSYHDYASMSIPERQPERYEKTIEAYKRFARNYPDSKFMNEANRLARNATEFLNLEESEVIISEIN